MERAEKKNDRFEHKTEQDPTIVYGKNAVTELLKSGAAVDTVFVQDTMNAAQAGYYTAIAREAGAVVKRVHAAKLRGMCGTEGHQGVAAWAASGQHRRGCPQAEGAECICLLRGHGRTPRFPAKPYRPHRAGGGQ